MNTEAVDVFIKYGYIHKGDRSWKLLLPHAIINMCMDHTMDMGPLDQMSMTSFELVILTPTYQRVSGLCHLTTLISQQMVSMIMKSSAERITYWPEHLLFL